MAGIKVCQTYNDFKGSANTWQQGHFRPLSFEYALYISSLEMFNKRRKALGNNQDITDELRVFVRSVQLPLHEYPTGALIKYPDDYSRFVAMRFFVKKEDESKGVMCKSMEVLEADGNCRPLREEEKADAIEESKLKEKRIDKIDTGNWDSFINHEFLGPSLTNVGCMQNSEGFRVEPGDIGYVVLDYLALPSRPVFAYTRDAKHNIICDPLKCNDLLWNEELLPELMALVKKKYASFVGNERKYNEAKSEEEDN